MISCKVYHDLILLYVSEECTQESKELVKEHLETCEECQRYYQELLSPIGPLESEPDILEERVKEFKVKKSFMKIRRQWYLSLVSVIIILVLITGCGYLTYNQVRGEGICYTNVDDILRMKSFFHALKTGNYEKAFTYIDTKKMYQMITIEQLAEIQKWKKNTSVTVDDNKLNDPNYKDPLQLTTEIADYYKKMGYETYREKLKNKFLNSMRELEAEGIKVEGYSIETVSYTKEYDEGLWMINVKVKGSQSYGYVDFGMYQDGLLLISCTHAPGNLDLLINGLGLSNDVDQLSIRSGE